MSAERLRQAAALMRGRAEVVDDWYSAQAWATASPMSLPIEQADAAHIASWHPAVALAVADWLEGVKQRHASTDNPWSVGQLCCSTCNLDLEGDERGHCDDFADALAVADAYLGTTS